MDWRPALAIVLGVVWIFFILTRKWGAWRRSRRARVRGARAVQGESDAEDLLIARGYQIVERQLRRTWTLLCDGEATHFELRADLLVERGGQYFIAEVKTGAKAPELSNAATRRQLLEYALAYNSPVILLVDVERNRVLEVSFPPTASARADEDALDLAAESG